MNSDNELETDSRFVKVRSMPETATRRGRPKGSGIDDSTRLEAIARLLATNPEMKPTTAIKSLGVSDPSIIRRLRDKYAEVRQSLAAELVNAEQQAAARMDEPVQATVACATAGSARPKRVRAAAAAARTASRRVAEPVCVDPRVEAKPDIANTSTTTTASASTTAARPARSSSRSKSTTPNKTAAATPAPIATEPPAVLEARDAGTSTAHSETALVTAAVSAAPATAPATEAANTTLDRPATPRQPVADDLFVSMFGLGVVAATSAMAAQLKFADKLARTPYVTLAIRQQLAFNEWAMRLVGPPPRPARKIAG
mgnify:CR=1 FL=1